MILTPGFIERVVELACRIQQIPAPTFHEEARAHFIRQCFESERLVSRVECDDAGNVFALVPGVTTNPPVVVSAHLDTVFPPGTDLSLVRTAKTVRGPGIGDNSLGVAALFAIIWALSEEKQSLPADLWLVGNSCEEGLGNLRGMRVVLERFGSQPAAYIVLEGLGLGEIFHHALGVRRFKVSVQTGGGHSWLDAGQPSAIHEAARLVTSLASLPLPRTPRTTLNVGVISGGTTVNTIAASASFELDLRCEDPAGLERLWRQVERLVAGAQKKGVQVSWEGIGTRPAGSIPVSHPLVVLARDCLRRQGVEGKPGIGSTDANLPLSLGIPAVSMGLTCGSGAHTTAEYIEIPPLAAGLQALVELIALLARNRT